MIIAENFNLKESLLFLLSARETLCFLVKESKVPYKKELKSFIINEASDYQILSLIVDGELPLNEFNYFDELVLFERIRLEVKENKNLVCEMFGADLFDDVTKKVDSIGPESLSEDKGMDSIMNMLANAGKKSTKVTPSKYPIDPDIQKFLDVGKKAAKKVAIPKNFPKANIKKAVNTRANIEKGFNNLKQQATSGSNAVTSFVKAHPAEISGVLLAVLAIYVSSKIYKRFFSKAAKSCSSYKGEKKTSCMKKFQLAGYKTQLIDLKRASTKCGMTKNPEKCVTAIQIKMDKINKKISKQIRG
jgi:hypothetical protein